MWSIFTLTGCSADTVLESWDLSQCQLPPAAAVSPCSALQGAEPSLRAWWAAGCWGAMQHESRFCQLYLCLQWSCCLMVEAVFLLYFKGFGMVSLVKSLLLLCQLLSTFLLCFYYKQMNLDFPESEFNYCWHCRLQQVFRLIQAGNTQTISKEIGLS